MLFLKYNELIRVEQNLPIIGNGSIMVKIIIKSNFINKFYQKSKLFRVKAM